VLGRLKKLLGGEADPAWFEAARTGDLERMREHLGRGARVDARDRTDDTALTWAATAGHLEACRLLIEHGADIEARQFEGATPLILAADRGHFDVVRLLVEHGADVNARHAGQEIGPMSFAARAGYREIVDFLEQAGASWRN
jgi:ankyrin repeat protein